MRSGLKHPKAACGLKARAPEQFSVSLRRQGEAHRF